MAKPRHKSKVSPSARSLQELRRQGYIGQSVEKRIPYSFITQDYIHCIDIIAFRENEVIGVQATTTTHITHRFNKALTVPELVGWLKAGCKFQVWGWSKKGPRGKKKHWTLTQRNLYLSDFPATTLAEFEKILSRHSSPP